MTNTDRLEAIYLSVWKDKIKYPFCALYNPPNNKANYDILPNETDCILFGDFNSPSTRWNYKKTTSVGQHLEDYIDTSPFDQITSSDPQDFTFLSPTGSKTNPDLILAHSNISKFVSQRSLTLLKTHGHKVIAFEINKKQLIQTKKTSYMSWNLNKANWDHYKQLSNEKFQYDFINGNSDASEKRIKSAFIQCAKESIPRGKINNYKPYWNANLDKLTKERDEAIKNLESDWTIDKHYILEECQKKLEKELIESKKTRFDEYITSMDYRTNCKFTHKKVSSFNENLNERSNEAIEQNGKLLTSNAMKAKCFVKHYTKVSSGSSKIDKIKKPSEIHNFTFNEFEEAVKELDMEKAPGDDHNITRIYCQSRSESSISAFNIFQFCITQWYSSLMEKSNYHPNFKA